MAYAAPDTTTRSIVIVEDDPAVLDSLAESFSHAGYAVTAVAAFDEAKAVLRANPPAVLLTDVRLGLFNGLHLAILARDISPATKVVVFSGFDDPVLQKEAERLGSTYLVKPVTFAQLEQAIRTGA